MIQRRRQAGFTMLELMVVIVIVGMLSALFVSTYTDIQRTQRNQERKRDIQDVYQQLEAYYVVNSKYPTLADMNNAAWIKANMKTLNRESLRDPSGTSYTLTDRPAKSVYAYQVSSATGVGCNNTATPCAHYSLTATFENNAQVTFVKSSLN